MRWSGREVAPIDLERLLADVAFLSSALLVDNCWQQPETIGLNQTIHASNCSFGTCIPPFRVGDVLSKVAASLVRVKAKARPRSKSSLTAAVGEPCFLQSQIARQLTCGPQRETYYRGLTSFWLRIPEVATVSETSDTA